MIQKLRERMGKSEGGFTLVELLVVMLILGLLAAIAIPSFFNQREKAQDSDAKASVRTAQTAMETYATDHQGKYTGAAGSDLEAIEATLQDAPNPVDVIAATDDSYKISVESDGSTGNVFEIDRNTDGTTDLKCGVGATLATPGKAGCPSSGTWG